VTTMDISSNLTAIIPPPRFDAVAGAYGYNDGEARLTAPLGGTYWNVTNNTQRYFNGTTWQNGGGGGTPGGTPGQIQFRKASQSSSHWQLRLKPGHVSHPGQSQQVSASFAFTARFLRYWVWPGVYPMRIPCSFFTCLD
jgi:hypothetical protein